MPSRDESNPHTVILLAYYNNSPYAIQVDEILSQQRIVFKSLGNELENLAGISGGTILADGKVALILETNDIISLHSDIVGK